MEDFDKEITQMIKNRLRYDLRDLIDRYVKSMGENEMKEDANCIDLCLEILRLSNICSIFMEGLRSQVCQVYADKHNKKVE